MGSHTETAAAGRQDAVPRPSYRGCPGQCSAPGCAACRSPAAACPNYPFCGAQSPADFPVPVANGEPLAPLLNTTPEQTRYYQEAQVAKSPANFPVPVINGENVAPGYNTVPAQTDAHENHLLIAQQQQLQQLIDAQTIQHRIQQQEIEAARHFGRL